METSSEIRERYKISKAELSRWVKAGCPYERDPQHSQRLIFDPDRVDAWVKGKTRPVKEYRVYTNAGRYFETVKGSKAASELLRRLPASKDIVPYAVDLDGVMFVFRSGKLRRV